MLIEERYVVAWRRPDGTRVTTEPLSVRRAGRVVRQLLRKHGAEEFYFDHGDGLGEPRTDIDKFIRRIRAVLKRQDPGERDTILGYADHALAIKVRVLVVSPTPEPDTSHPGTEQTQRWMGIVKMFWPDARFAGSVVCKPDSDHALGAAVDYFDTPENMQAMHELAIGNGETKYSIYRDEIWTAGPPWTTSSRGRHDYTGAFHYHHHRSSKDGVRGVYCTSPPGYGA